MWILLLSAHTKEGSFEVVDISKRFRSVTELVVMVDLFSFVCFGVVFVSHEVTRCVFRIVPEVFSVVVGTWVRRRAPWVANSRKSIGVVKDSISPTPTYLLRTLSHNLSTILVLWLETKHSVILKTPIKQ